MSGRWGRRQRRLLRIWQGLALGLLGLAVVGWLLSRPQEDRPLLIVEPQQGVAPLIRFIDGARSSLDGEIYLLTSPDVLAALEAAPGRGVRVRLLLERRPFGGGGGPSPEETFARLARHGVQVRWAPRRFRLTHAKMLLADGRRAWVGTMNWSAAAFSANRDFALVSLQRAAVDQLEALFDADWRDRPVSDGVSRLVVSPINARSRLRALIRGSRHRLDVYAEVLGDRELAGLLVATARRGVRTRVIWAGKGDVGELRSGGVQLVICRRPYPHAKVLIADADRAFVGSQNATAAGLDQNREVGLIVRDSDVVDELEQTFAGDFAAGVPVGVGSRG